MITVDEYFKLETVKKNYHLLFSSYEQEFKMPAIDIYKGFVEYKQGVVDIINPDNLMIFDISGHSLFSPLLVFHGRYAQYHMFNPGIKLKSINNEIFNEIGVQDSINYLSPASPSAYFAGVYDVILDWNGIVNFGIDLDYDMFKILNAMINQTKKWVIFEATRFLRVADTTFDFHEFFDHFGITYHTKKAPSWMNDPGCLRYVLEVPR